MKWTENKYIHLSSLEWSHFCYNTRVEVYTPAINDAYKCYDTTLCAGTSSWYLWSLK